AGCLDRQLRLFRRRKLPGQKLERGNCKEEESNDRTKRPDDLDRRVMAGLGRNRVCAFTEPDNDDDEQNENKQRDRDDEPQCVLLEPAKLFHDRSCGRLKAELPVDWLICKGGRSKKQTADGGQNCKSFVFHNIS